MYRVEFRTNKGNFWVRASHCPYVLTSDKAKVQEFKSWYLANAARQTIKDRRNKVQGLGYIIYIIKDRQKAVEMLSRRIYNNKLPSNGMTIRDLNEMVLCHPDILMEAKALARQNLPKDGYKFKAKLLAAHNYMIDHVQMLHNKTTGKYLANGLLIHFNGIIFEYIEGDRAIYDKVREAFKTEFKYI